MFTIRLLLNGESFMVFFCIGQFSAFELSVYLKYLVSILYGYEFLET